MKIQGIYKIKNLINNKIYIGQSIDIIKRFEQHKTNIKKQYNHPLYNALRKYRIENFEFIILETVNDTFLLNKKEQQWLDHYKAYDRNYGYNLRPKAESNKGLIINQKIKDKISKSIKNLWKDPIYRKNNKCSSETKKKLSSANKGRKLSEEHKNKISFAKSGKKQSKQHKLNRSNSRKDYKTSDETKLKISIANTGKVRTIETRKKLSLLNTGKKLSEETKRKIAKTHIGKKQTKETIEKKVLSRKGYKHSNKTKIKIANSNKGKVVSDKTKQKMAESAKLRWQKK